MKKIVTCLSVLMLTFGASAQIEIYTEEDGSTDVSGTIVDLTNGDEDMEQVFDIQNASGGPLDLRISRVKIVELAGTQDYLCWGKDELTGDCYPAAAVSAENPWTTPSDATIEAGDHGWLSTHHDTQGNPGCAQYRYYVIDGSDMALDSVDVMFCSTVSIEEEVKVNISVYPNPAVDFVNVVMEDNFNNVEFKLFNVLGDVVLSDKLIKGTNKVNVESMPNGVYFYSVLKEGETIETKKLVIRG